MKKNLQKKLLAIVFLLSGMCASAYDLEVDGIYYNKIVSTSTVQVTSCDPESNSNSYSGTVVIPETVSVNGVTYTVTSIGTYAFRDCTGLTSVTIPASVTSIEYCAFEGCTGLTEVTIGNGVTSIGRYAFYRCTGLTEVTIGNGVTSIGNNAFQYCTGLTSITIPNSVTSIGEMAFSDCYKIGNIYFDDIATICNGVWSALPRASSVNYYYNNELLTELVIPDSVTSIGSMAFDGCTSLTSITIPNSVTSIGNWAFSNCTGLTSITIPNSVTSIGRSAFSGCTGLTSITIPDGVTSIEYGAFEGCTGLTSITIPNSVTSIDNNTFYGCTGLTSITIPDGVTSIEYGAFEGCTGLTEITIPDGVTSIGYYAFQNCTGLTSITIPNSVTSIDDYAFRGCTGLKEVIMEDGEAVLNLGNNNSKGLFNDCPIHTLYLGRTLSYDASSSGGYSPIYNKKTLTSVTIGDSVTSIGNWAFSNCTGLTLVAIPESVTSIGGSAFSGCTGLTSITIPESVTSIRASAFRGCTGLTEITIPNSVTWIGGSAFSGCTGLTEITIPNSVTSIDDYAFSGCTGLTSVTIPASVTSIGDDAFYGCTGLTSITIPNSVTSIGDYAFRDCTGLTSITIPNSVALIDNNTFSGCTGLTSITIPESVTSIRASAFSGCTGLTSITIPNSVTSIGNSAFSGCTGLKEVIMEDGEAVLNLGNNNRKGLFNDCPIHTLYLGRTLSYDASSSGGYSPFYNQIYLKNLTIGNIRILSENLFNGCSNLAGNLTLSSSIDSIVSNAFAGTGYKSCHILAAEPPVVVDAGALGNITFVRVPKGSRTAYKTADVWKDLTIVEEDPEYEVEITVTEPGKLSQDIVMEYMIVPQSVTKLKVHGTINVEDFKQMRTNMTSCYSIDLSDADCVALPDSAFEGKYYLTELILPNNCRSIGKAAFVNCTGLDSIVIPDNVSIIGERAFMNCKGLKSVIIPNGVTSIGNNAFQNCKSLTSVTIPNSVTSLGVYAFSNCQNLQTIQLSQSLTVIKSYTFSNCGLKEISIPGSVTSIENQAFTSCSSLENIVFEDSEKTLNLGCNKDSGTDYTQGQGLFYNCPIQTLYIGRNLSYNTSKSCGYSPFCGLETKAWDTVLQNGKISSVAFGDKVTNIGERLLAGNPNLKSIKMGANISSISTYAFSGDTLDVDYSNLSVLYKCGDVINSAHKVNLYHNGVPLTHIDLPDNMTTVKTNQFKNIINLESVNIPNSVKSIKANAFDGCISLKSVSFSDSITTVGYQAFGGCTSLTTVNLPDSITTIGNQAFKGCTSLTTVNLSDTLQSIGNEAFYGCSALANITCPALVPPTVGTDGFEGVDNYTCILTIPGDSLMNYMLAEHWGAFIQKRKRIDVDVETPVVDEGVGEGESGSEGDSSTGTGTGNHCGGHIWYDRDWHKHHGGHHAPRRYAAAEEETAVSGIDATIGDGLSLFIATDSVVTFLIEPEEGYNIGSVRYGGVDVTDQLNNGVFTTSAVSANTKLEVSFVEGEVPVVAGDANDDATVNISDVVVIVNYILGDESGVTSVDNADVNEDGVINIGDVPGVVNIILSASVQAAPIRNEGAEGVLSMNDVIIAQGETTGIEVSLDNAVPYTAFQMDVTLPEGLTANDITLSNRISSTHSLMWRMQDDNTLRVVVFAPDNSTIADNRGALFTIDVTAGSAFEGGHIVADNTIFTARDLTMHYLDGAEAAAINPAGVDGIYTADRIYTIGRTLVIESTCNQAAYITTTGGVMRAVELQAGRNEIAMLQQGLYIVVVGSETQKVIIR